MNGFAPSDLYGNYKRPKGITINSKYDINNENGQIYLLVGHSCPWCQRTLLVQEIKDLSKKVKVIYLKADVEHGEWILNTKIKWCIRLSDLYKKANKKIIFRATLPLLISFVKDEVSITSGYQYNTQNSITAKSGKNKIKFDVKKENFAWIGDTGLERKMVNVMKKGSRIMITGYNQSGSQTIDHYSLMGFTKAYNTAKKSCA